MTPLASTALLVLLIAVALALWLRRRVHHHGDADRPGFAEIPWSTQDREAERMYGDLIAVQRFSSRH